MFLPSFFYTVASIYVGCYSDNYELNFLECFSYHDAQQVENPGHWNSLHVKGSRNGELWSVKEDTFRRFSNLSNLLLKGVTELEPGFLNGLDYVAGVTLLDGKIDEIKPYVFAKQDLGSVSITNGQLKEIHPHAFENSEYLLFVLIAENNIHTIRSGVFNNSKINNLYLRHNDIHYIEEGAFLGMNNLTQLVLSYNKLKSFSSGKLFGQNLEIETLCLAANQFTELNKDMFHTLPNLKFVNVSRNFLTTIEEGTFANLEKLERLDLSRNNLRELEANVLPSTTVIRELYLHNNLFSYIALEVLNKLPKLTDITLLNNPWECSCVKHVEEWTNKHNVTKFCHQNAATPIYCISHPTDESKCHYELEKSEYALAEYNKTHQLIQCVPRSDCYSLCC